MNPIPIPAANRERAAEKARQFIMAAYPGDECEVMVTRKKRRRSDPQNRYWWGVVVKTFCEHLPGWDKDDVHDYLLGEHFGWERLEGLGRVRLRPVNRSSKLGKIEFAELVGHAQRIGAAHGIYISDPGES